MKLARIAFVVALVLSLTGLAAAQTWVNPYVRRDGTVVQGHMRTRPDGNPYNNYSTPGNHNPNTGRTTGGNLDRYLGREQDRGTGYRPLWGNR